ncbi:MGMT family protein [Candidatus Nomurabacteria bacterium]|uniref:MGMT family protein n=1 Tax=Candidatus Dojkabacteria bacterium TaxID=2099670 RepID=A0A955KYI2_9BACT|nr:MGMT family protein [Candidatus Dojkabacteria bacterium]MCB9790297.1 MGMT family protein [Candidatus Nomurabacteria bacterium]
MVKYSELVFDIVRAIPSGSVITYGQIAAKLGDARKARVVGWVLPQITIFEEEIPWSRVITFLI